MGNKKYLLSASVICADFYNLKSDINSLIKGNIDYLHIDIMDGSFVPRFGLFPEIITSLRKYTSIPFDIHMMVDDPENYIDVFKNAGLTQNDIFTVHIESTRHIDRVLRRIKDSGLRAGVAINPGTSLDFLDYVLSLTDLVLIMGINPGIVGHKFIPDSINKIKQVVRKIENHPNIIIEIDGGVTPQTAKQMINAGAKMLVCGTQTIFRKHEAPIIHKITELKDSLT